MSDPSAFCSDCSWPLQCGEDQKCVRRDHRDIRARHPGQNINVRPILTAEQAKVARIVRQVLGEN